MPFNPVSARIAFRRKAGLRSARKFALLDFYNLVNARAKAAENRAKRKQEAAKAQLQEQNRALLESTRDDNF